MTRIERVVADISTKSHITRVNPPDPRHPRSIPYMSKWHCLAHNRTVYVRMAQPPALVANRESPPAPSLSRVQGHIVSLILSGTHFAHKYVGSTIICEGLLR